MVNKTITVNDEFNALAIAYARAAKMDNPMEGAIQKLNLAKSIARDAEAIGAEMVVARYFGLDYDVNISQGKRNADVGKGIEVKWTSYINGSLIIYPNDRLDDVAVLVVGRSPDYYIAGWLPVKMAMQKQFKNSQQESWWVGQASLNPIGDLERSSYAATHI